MFRRLSDRGSIGYERCDMEQAHIGDLPLKLLGYLTMGCEMLTAAFRTLITGHSHIYLEFHDVLISK
ncbi:MAG: hypothetical protein QXE79_05695 [Candidatus Bathyarchaeia archaeon]